MGLGPGARLSEVAIAERLGASRTPVREAIRRLSREGLVRFTPGEVAQVAPISLRGVRGRCSSSGMILEPAAVRMVTMDALSSPVLLAPFRQIADEFDELAADLGNRPREESVDRFYELAERFDQVLIKACHNEPLATTIADRRGQTARLRISPTPIRAGWSGPGGHRRVCRAMLDGDPDAAAHELTHHLAETLRTITEGLTRNAGREGGLDIEILPPSA